MGSTPRALGEDPRLPSAEVSRVFSIPGRCPAEWSRGQVRPLFQPLSLEEKAVLLKIDQTLFQLDADVSIAMSRRSSSVT